MNVWNVKLQRMWNNKLSKIYGREDKAKSKYKSGRKRMEP